MPIMIHKDFELNGHSFDSTDDLIEFSESISSEIKLFLNCFLSKLDTIKLQTSGSTGNPKVIEVRKIFMVNSAKATGCFFNINKKTTALLCMNFNYVGAQMMLVRALVLGWKLDVVEPNSNPLKEINKSYDFCAMVPIQVAGSLASLNKIKILIIGGGIVSKKLLNALQKIKTVCFSTYGMTETVSHIAMQKLNNFKDVISSAVEKSHYKVLPNIAISTDKRNCLVINAPKIASEEIITNDVVEIISDSEFKWIGRYDNIINSGGIKLNPEQIEEKLSKIIKERFFITSVPDTVLGEKIILIVEGTSTPLNDQKNVILNEMKNLKSLSKYEIPKEIYFVSNFVETETKKIQRNKTLNLIQK